MKARVKARDPAAAAEKKNRPAVHFLSLRSFVTLAENEKQKTAPSGGLGAVEAETVVSRWRKGRGREEERERGGGEGEKT